MKKKSEEKEKTYLYRIEMKDGETFNILAHHVDTCSGMDIVRNEIGTILAISRDCWKSVLLLGEYDEKEKRMILNIETKFHVHKLPKGSVD